MSLIDLQWYIWEGNHKQDVHIAFRFQICYSFLYFCTIYMNCFHKCYSTMSLNTKYVSEATKERAPRCLPACHTVGVCPSLNERMATNRDKESRFSHKISSVRPSMSSDKKGIKQGTEEHENSSGQKSRRNCQ